MPWRACLKCSTLTQGSYCPTCQPSRKTEGRSSREQDRFRHAVCVRAGWQCEVWEDVDGEWVRCPEQANLEAHHLGGFRRKRSMDARDGLAVCRAHHIALEDIENAEARMN